MTTAPASPPMKVDTDSLLVEPSLRDVCLRIPMSSALSDEELERINQLNEGWKIEVGRDCELEVTMIAGGDSSDITFEIVRQLGNWRVSEGGGRSRESDGTYHVFHPDIGRRTRAPDVSWISPSLLESTPRSARPKRGFWSLCPSFVVEVRSPSDSLAAQQQRMREWLLFGAELGWLVDPLERTVWIYRPDDEPVLLLRPERVGGEDVLVGLDVDFREIWQWAEEQEAE